MNERIQDLTMKAGMAGMAGNDQEKNPTAEEMGPQIQKIERELKWLKTDFEMLRKANKDEVDRQMKLREDHVKRMNEKSDEVRESYRLAYLKMTVTAALRYTYQGRPEYLEVVTRSIKAWDEDEHYWKKRENWKVGMWAADLLGRPDLKVVEGG